MENVNFKIVLINHTFQINYYSRRWKILAEQHPNVDVTLLTPKKYRWYPTKDYSYGNGKVVCAKEQDDNNFHIRLYRQIENKYFGWRTPDFGKLFRAIDPDIICFIGSHNQYALGQVLRAVERNRLKAKVIAHSMRGPHHQVKIKEGRCNPIVYLGRRIIYLDKKTRLNYVNKHCKAMFCHYPDAVEAFRNEGFAGPIYMQTQVGVNTEWFHPDAQARGEIRDKYALGDAFVFGSASRFNPTKGMFDVIAAMPKEGNWKFLMMGSGSQEETQKIRQAIRERGLEDKIILTGFVDWYEIAKYWNAIDCAIHVPRTTQHWTETFSLVVVQAMITGKPIIGDTSGSVPYQIGPDGIIVPEGDVQALHEKIQWVLDHPVEAAEIGRKMQERAESSFSVQHLDDMFYDTLLDVLEDKFDPAKADMTKYPTRKTARQ